MAKRGEESAFGNLAIQRNVRAITLRITLILPIFVVTDSYNLPGEEEDNASSEEVPCGYRVQVCYSHFQCGFEVGTAWQKRKSIEKRGGTNRPNTFIRRNICNVVNSFGGKPENKRNWHN